MELGHRLWQVAEYPVGWINRISGLAGKGLSGWPDTKYANECMSLIYDNIIMLLES